MPRRKAAEVEILPPEDDQPSRGRKKLVEAEHTIKYSAPVPVTVEDDAIEDGPEDFDFVEEEKAKRRKKTARDEREALQREMDKLGVASSSRLKLSVDKYRHSDSDDSGTLAEKDFCTKYAVAKEHILNEDYLEVARRYGPGRYWFTLRMDNKIIRQWERQINPAVSTTPVIQHVNPADPTSPQVIVQTTSDGQQPYQPMSMKDIMKAQKEAFKEQLEMAKLMREAYGLVPDQSANQPRSEEEILSSAILKQPEVIENVVGSVIKRFGGKSDNDEPWYADVVRDAVKSGQLVQVVQVAIDRIFNGFGNLFPGRQNNGQAQMDQAPLAQSARSENPSQQNRQADQFRESLPAQSQSQGASSIVETGSNASLGQQQMTPEEHALQRLIDNCRRGVPVQVAFEQLINYADAINDQAPQYSIDGYISIFAAMPIEAALEFVKTQPNGEQVVSLPHAKTWTEDLQKLIKEAGQEGEE